MQWCQDGFITSLPLLDVVCMMPLVDPRRSTSQADTRPKPLLHSTLPHHHHHQISKTLQRESSSKLRTVDGNNKEDRVKYPRSQRKDQTKTLGRISTAVQDITPLIEDPIQPKDIITLHQKFLTQPNKALTRIQARPLPPSLTTRHSQPNLATRHPLPNPTTGLPLPTPTTGLPLPTPTLKYTNPATRHPQPNPATRHTQPNLATRHTQPNPTTRHTEPIPATRHSQPIPATRHSQPIPATRHIQPSATTRHTQPGPNIRHTQPSPSTRHLPPTPASSRSDHQATGGNSNQHRKVEGKGNEGWNLVRLEEESEVALERRRQQLTRELMREMAGDSHHHHHHHHHHLSSTGEKKIHGQHGTSSGHHRRNPSSSSSSSSSSTSSSTSSSSSSSSSHHPTRCGSKRDGSSSGKRKSRLSKRGNIPSASGSGDRAKMKKAKSSSSLRKHSSSKSSKKGHPSKKEHDKLRGHKSSRSPTRRKISMAKKLLSPVRKHSPSPQSSRKTHKLSPGRSKRSKSRKRSGSPRDRLDYRSDRMALAERSLSHTRDPSAMVPHGAPSSSSSRAARDPRIDERVRRVSPEQLTRDRYRYEKERVEEYVEPRRERRSSPSQTRAREAERKEPHRHRDYERSAHPLEREHYEERRREDARREEREREREQLRERELRERELLRDRELMKERERVEIMEREQERERERLREVEERRSRYGREHEFVRDREVVLRGASTARDYPEERDYYAAARVRPEIDPRALALEDRRAYDESAYDRFQSERERVRFESGRSRYEDVALHDRRGIPPLDDRCPDRRPPPPLDTRFPEDRRRGSTSVDPRVHDPWGEPERELDRLVERPDHYTSHAPHPLAHPRHRHHQPQWPSNRATPPGAWDRHKLSRHDDWGDEYARGGGGGAHAADWGEEAHEWGADRGGPPAPLHQDQWSQHSRRGYRDDWGGREAEWLDPYASSRDLLPPPSTPPSVPPHHHQGGRGGERAQPPPPQPTSSSSSSMGRRSRREPVDQSMEPPLHPPSHHHHHHHHHHHQTSSRHQMPASTEEETVEGGALGGSGGGSGSGGSVRGGGRGDVPSSPLPEQDQAHMPGNDGELWEYDPGKGSWVRQAAESTVSTPAQPEARDSPVKKDKTSPETTPQEEPVAVVAAAAAAAVPMNSEDKKRTAPEERSADEPEAKRVRPDSPSPAPAEPDTALQEKDTFSDISDDADDILNQEVGGFIDEDSRNVSTSQIEPETRNISRDNGPSYDDLLDEEEETHFEEISDDELEEDRQAKFNVAGALDINWAVLVRDSAKSPAANEVAAGTALKRFQAHHLLARLGVSSRFARPEVVKKIRDACVKTADEEDSTTQDGSGEVKKPEVCDVVCGAGVWRLVQAQGHEGQRILDGVGPNRRALCARQDIRLRRQLCNLPAQDLIGDTPLIDKDLFRQSVALLKSC
ncbi:hypothetical protein Pmani_001685 [Petrolisthes manimaculis]|uniref:Zinc finger CCCH domain-containing protein 13 n=1 Tax=Petrolisthes manimaculis TaxID=1843537 RepID=A0AAE1QK48_9EUCA|nr:hypothetical protein Pmani_001685 [Petrolisthes manimaculis]